MSPLVVIVGETASGKSSLAIKIAKHFGGEIIAADAMTVYRDFDIGTAKPSAADRQEIPHHLLDVATADKGFTVAQFQQLAYESIDDITKRGRLPVLVGGSGLYVDSVLYDYSFADQADTDLRKKLNAMSLEDLQKVALEGGFSLDTIDAQNKRRIIRLIETKGRAATKHDLREATVVLGVSRERHELLDAVEQRVDVMLAAGLEREVRQLSEEYGWAVEPMRSVGYREWQAYFEGERSFDEVRQQIIIDTMKLAKKQRTWFKRNKSIHWIQSDEFDDIVTTLLNKYPL